MGHSQLLPDHWGYWDTIHWKQDGHACPIFATANYCDAPEPRTRPRCLQMPAQRPHQCWPLEQILVSVIVIFIDFFNKGVDKFVTCSKDQGRTILYGAVVTNIILVLYGLVCTWKTANKLQSDINWLKSKYLNNFHLALALLHRPGLLVKNLYIYS